MTLLGGWVQPANAMNPPSKVQPLLIEVADLEGSRELVSSLQAKGLAAVIPPKNMRVVDGQTNCVVWIGKDVPLETLRWVLPEAMRVFPHLKFFYVVGDRGEQPPEQVNRTIHVGGSIEAALVMKLNAIDQTELKKQLAVASSVHELHLYLHQGNKAKGPGHESAPSPVQ